MRWAFVLFCLSLAAQEKEAALSKQIAEGLLRSTTLVESAAAQDYVAQFGTKLAVGAYSFRAVTADGALHEPVVLPGNYVFVPVNLLLTAKDESEFAGVLAQALARGAIRIESHTGTIPVVFYDGFGSGGNSNLLPTAVRARRRQLELQADIAAVPLLSRAGFDPAGLLRYLERMQPTDDRRIIALRTALRDLAAPAYTDSEAFHRAQEQVRPAPPSPRKPPSLYP
jgi:predicted Zn-dependent protease